MARLCGRPGCSEPGAVAYGMMPEDLLFWISPIRDAPTADPSLLCLRHADAMIVPGGWTLDDRREEIPRLFNTRRLVSDASPPAKPKRRRTNSGDAPQPEQMQIDGTGEIVRPKTPVQEPDPDVDAVTEAWQPDFDADDDLDGLLEVESPLLARAFRGTDRPKN